MHKRRRSTVPVTTSQDPVSFWKEIYETYGAPPFKPQIHKKQNGSHVKAKQSYNASTALIYAILL